MQQLFARLCKLCPEGSSRRHVFQLAGGTAFGQIAAILAAPILARLYTPEDYGVVALFAACLGVLSAFTGLNYPLALPMIQEESKVREVFFLSFCLHLILVGVFAIGLVFWGNLALRALRWEKLLPYLWFLPVSWALVGLYSIFNYIAFNKKMFSAVAQTKITQRLLGTGVSLSCGFFGVRPLGLVLGQIASQTGGIIFLGRKLVRPNLVKRVTFNSLRQAALDYIDFPLYQTLGTFCNILSIQLPPLLLSSFAGPEVTGWFGFCMRFLNLPMALMGAAVGQVFYPRAGELGQGKDLTSLVKKTAERMLRLGVFPFLFLMYVAKPLFGFAFGISWEVAGVYASYMAPYVLMQFVASPLSTVFFVLKKQRLLISFQMIMLFSRGLSLWIGSLLGGIYCPILIFGAMSFCIYFVYLLLIFQVVNINKIVCLSLVIKEIRLSILYMLPIVVLGMFFRNLFVEVIYFLFAFGRLIYTKHKY